MHDITRKLNELVEALRRIDGVIVTHAKVRPARATAPQLERMPADWQAFYRACDGLELRWRHPRSGRDGEWFRGGKPTRRDTQDVWELDHNISGIIDLQPARVVLDGGRYWNAFTAKLPPGMPQHHLRPFDVYSASQHVFVDSRTWKLCSSEAYHEAFTGQLGLERYLERLLASAGHQDRARVFGRKALPDLGHVTPEVLLAGDWVAAQRRADPFKLAAMELAAGRGLAGWQAAHERLPPAARKLSLEGLGGAIARYPAEHQAFVALLGRVWKDAQLTPSGRFAAVHALNHSPVLARLDLGPLVAHFVPGEAAPAALGLMELFSRHPACRALVRRELPRLREQLHEIYDDELRSIARRVGLKLTSRSHRAGPRLRSDPRA